MKDSFSGRTTGFGFMLVVVSLVVQAIAAAMASDRSSAAWGWATVFLQMAYVMGAVGALLAAIGRAGEPGAKPLYAVAACSGAAALIVTWWMLCLVRFGAPWLAPVHELSLPLSFQLFADAGLLFALSAILLRIGHVHQLIARTSNLAVVAIALGCYALFIGMAGDVAIMVIFTQLSLIVPIWQTHAAVRGHYVDSEDDPTTRFRRLAVFGLAINLLVMLFLLGASIVLDDPRL